LGIENIFWEYENICYRVRILSGVSEYLKKSQNMYCMGVSEYNDECGNTFWSLRISVGVREYLFAGV
jgi:hypothetical protein